MDNKKNASLFVIVGHWNPSIFTSEWVKDFLFPDENELKVELSIEKHYAVKIETKTLQIHVNEVLFKVSVLTDSTEALMSECQDIVFKMCGYLSHTPVRAMGVNFTKEYKIEQFSEYKNLFDLPDNAAIEKLGYENCNSYKINRLYKVGNKDLNLFLELCEDKKIVKIAFNHHYNLQKMNDIKEVLSESDVIDLSKQSDDFLKNVYKL